VVAPSAPIKLVSPVLGLVCSNCCKLSRTKKPKKYIENFRLNESTNPEPRSLKVFSFVNNLAQFRKPCYATYYAFADYN